MSNLQIYFSLQTTYIQHFMCITYDKVLKLMNSIILDKVKENHNGDTQ